MILPNPNSREVKGVNHKKICRTDTRAGQFFHQLDFVALEPLDEGPIERQSPSTNHDARCSTGKTTFTRLNSYRAR